MKVTSFHQFTLNQDNQINSPENSYESPASPTFHDSKATSTSSPRPRRGTQKRVVYVPIKDVEGSRLRAETNAPPPDSWAWRKYGQKPIKGSPYPRGYYRCSSSKGCPARKQVERSRTDPTMVMVTYSCEHNHPWPAASRNNTHHRNPQPPSPTTTEPTNSDATEDQSEDQEPDQEPDQELPIQTRQPEPELIDPDAKLEPDKKFTSLEVNSCGPFMGTTTNQYGWFSDFDATTLTMLESPMTDRDMVEDNYMTTIFSVTEDEESFFADLGELPECTTVFRRREIERAESHRRNFTPWCDTTG